MKKWIAKVPRSVRIGLILGFTPILIALLAQLILG